MLDDIDVRYFLEAHQSDTIGNIGTTDISVSCPICMEGKSWKRKHRLHLYTKPTYENPAVHCWNCSYSSNLYGYLKEHHPSIFNRYIKAKKGKGFEELKMHHSKKELPKEMILESNEDLNVFNKPTYFEPLENHKSAVEYLNNRGITPLNDWCYSPNKNTFMFNNVSVTLSDYIIIPLTKNKKWYGFQALAWKEKKFFIYLLTGNSSYKIWNWFNIDKSKPVYIFESIYDALSSGLDNIVAQLGATIDENRLKELEEPIFCLDNFRVDERAKEELKEYSKQYKVFIWPKKIPNKIKDFNDLRKLGVSYDKISNMITSNIKTGLSASIEVKMA